jgi:hypothetical protein
MILSNEMAFLKQKMPFLYENYSQLIFYDLDVNTSQHSTDGSWEYINDYPDPEKKIVAIDKLNPLQDVKVPQESKGVPAKQGMFAHGSTLVRDDIDVFWCNDADEFCNKSLITKVENLLETSPDVHSIAIDHYTFWKDPRFIFCTPEKSTMPYFPRICRHLRGRSYGHCSLLEQFPTLGKIPSEKFYHFSYTGRERMIQKLNFYIKHASPAQKQRLETHYYKYIEKVYDAFNPSNVDDKYIYGYPNMHPNPDLEYGIMKFTKEFPDYIDLTKI